MIYYMVDVTRFHHEKVKQFTDYTLLGDILVGQGFRLISSKEDHTLRATEVLRILKDGDDILWVETQNSRYKVVIKYEIEALPPSEKVDEDFI